MNSLEKTKRINMLMDLYGELLTEKQYTYCCFYYYNEDYSLSKLLKNLVFQEMQFMTTSSVLNIF